MHSTVLTIIVLATMTVGCAIGGSGGRDGGDATTNVGPINGKIEACVATTGVECNRSTGVEASAKQSKSNNLPK